MRFALNENMPGAVVRALRDAGHDVLSIKEAMRGVDDRTVLARAQAETRIVVTQDKDFGELAFRYGLPAECGIILFRLSGSDADADTRRMLDVLASRDDWPGHFAVASDDRVRIRPLAGLPPREE
jgi:predicted nuclease of predicted toxin-antitoxin system